MCRKLLVTQREERQDVKSQADRSCCSIQPGKVTVNAIDLNSCLESSEWRNLKPPLRVREIVPHSRVLPDSFFFDGGV